MTEIQFIVAILAIGIPASISAIALWRASQQQKFANQLLLAEKQTESAKIVGDLLGQSYTTKLVLESIIDDTKDERDEVKTELMDLLRRVNEEQETLETLKGMIAENKIRDVLSIEELITRAHLQAGTVQAASDRLQRIRENMDRRLGDEDAE